MRSSEDQAYVAYRDEVAGEKTVPALRVAIVVAIAVTATFPILDWIVYPDLFWQMLQIRGALAVAFGFIWLVCPRAPEKAMLGATLVEGLHLVSVIGVAGGVTSSYYPGILLLFLGAPILMPLSIRQAVAVLGPVFLFFAALPLISGETVSLGDYSLSMFFVGGALSVSLAGSYVLDSLRFQDHLRRAEITAAHDQLAELDQIKTRFSANVHHELRTPLTLMLAPLEGLRAGDYGEVPPIVERTFRTMHVNGQRLLKLINNLLDLAKLESNLFEIHRAPVDLEQILEDIVEGARPMADRKKLRLSTHGLANLPSLNADSDAIEKIVVNLLGNSLKFTEAGGTIVVGAEPVDGGIELYVQDSGVGIAPDQLGRVFDRFAQVDSSATRHHEGTGIGLSLTLELVELHEGRVWAESEGVGHGATMRVFLPSGASDARPEESVLSTTDSGDLSASSSREAVKAEMERMQTEGLAPIALAGANGKYLELDRTADRWQGQHSESAFATDNESDDRPQILVTDDNADMRELISFILGRDFRIRTARNGREAMELLQSIEPDLVVSDIMMPEMSGTELCRAIKSDSRLRDIPVMLVSSKAESEMKIEGLQLGADDYVTKPFHPRELLARAKSHASLHRARRNLSEQNAELESTLKSLRNAEEKLVESERLAAVGEVAAGIAHEVNNPVNYSLNASRTLAREVEELSSIVSMAAALDWDNAPALADRGRDLRHKIESSDAGEISTNISELTEIISDGLQRTSRLVNDLRNFASPSQTARPGSFDMGDAVRQSVRFVQHESDQSGVTIETNIPNHNIEVSGDADAVGQVFLNLLKNSIDSFEGEPGSVTINVRDNQEAALVEIRDNGPGIDPAVLGRIFEPFVTTKAAGKGTGLGLPICRKIAIAHGGSIEAESNLGEGSTFTFSLPKKEQPNQTHPDPKASSA